MYIIIICYNKCLLTVLSVILVNLKENKMVVVLCDAGVKCYVYVCGTLYQQW